MNSSIQLYLDVDFPPGADSNSSPGVLVVNHSGARPPPYSPEATAAIATIITLMMLFTIFGNILVIIAVLTSRALHGPQNLFLVSLAAADILVATLIIPFSLANELMGYWYFRAVWCEIYLALDVLFCTSSIVHLCAISLDRYLSISRPVSYTSRRTPGRIKAAIVVVWLIAAVISFPPLLSMNKSPEDEHGGGPQCQLNNDRWYILYSTIGSFFAPCLIMILVYVRIYQIAKRHNRCPPGEPRKELSINSPPHGVGGRGGTATQQNGGSLDPPGGLSKRARTSRSSTLDVPSSSSAPVLAGAPASVNNQKEQQLPPSSALSVADLAAGPTTSLKTSINTTTNVTPKPKATQRKAVGREMSKDGCNGDRSSPESDNDSLGRHGANGMTRVSSVGSGHGTRAIALKWRSIVATSKGTQLASIHNPKLEGTPNMARRKALVNREKRFTFVLAVVIGVFVICWFPFFFSYSLKAICPEACSLPDPLFNFFFWIGYCNSSLNPLIYTIFNKDFRKAFKKILCKNTKDSFF